MLIITSQVNNKYQYLGTCISMVDDACIWDATEMAQIIENSDPFDINKIIPFVSNNIRIKFKNNPDNFESGLYKNIVWVYDLDQDIHYFYRFMARKPLVLSQGMNCHILDTQENFFYKE